LDFREVHPYFVGEVVGIDLRKELGTEQIAAINRGMDKYGVLIFRGQNIAAEHHLSFSRYFGKPIEGDKFTRVGNLRSDGQIFTQNDMPYWQNVGSRIWHTDGVFRPIPPTYSILSSQIVPTTGGNTDFAFMPAAYDLLNPNLKECVDGLIAEHSLLYLWMKLGFSEFSDLDKSRHIPARQKLVVINERTNRKSLYLSGHIGIIKDWSMPESLCLVNELMFLATQNEFTYSHSWEVGDVVMWDNMQCMHRMAPDQASDQVRSLRRTTIMGQEPTANQYSPGENVVWNVSGIAV